MSHENKWWLKNTEDALNDSSLSTPLIGLPKFRGQPKDIEAQKNYYDDDAYLYDSTSDEESDEESEKILKGSSEKKEKRNSTRHKKEEGGSDDGSDGPDGSDDSDDSNESEESDEEEEKKPWSTKFIAVSGLGAVAMLINFGSMYLAYSTSFLLLAPTTIAAIGAGVVGSAVVPIVVYRESLMGEITSAREGINRIRQEVNQLGKQNKRLAKSRKNMAKELKKLKECEEKLTDTVERNGASVDEFLDLVEENQKIMEKMKGHFNAKIIQDCVRIIIKFDKDQDFILSSRELPMLIYSLKSFDINIPDEAAFKGALTDKSVAIAIDYVTKILEESQAEDAKNDKYGLSHPDAMDKYRNISED